MNRFSVLVLAVFVFLMGSAILFTDFSVNQSASGVEISRGGQKIPAGILTNPDNNDVKNRQDRKQQTEKKKRKSSKQENSGKDSEQKINSGKNDNSKSTGKNQEFQQELKAIEQQIADEETRFSSRKAMLEQKKQQAEQKSDAATAERTEGILKREQVMHDRKIRNMEEKKRKMLELIEHQSVEDANRPAK